MNTIKQKPTLVMGFGIINETIAKQLKQQGFKFDKQKVKEFENIRNSINTLYFARFLTEKAKTKATSKLFVKLTEHIAIKNNFKFPI